MIPVTIKTHVSYPGGLVEFVRDLELPVVHEGMTINGLLYPWGCRIERLAYDVRDGTLTAEIDWRYQTDANTTREDIIGRFVPAGWTIHRDEVSRGLGRLMMDWQEYDWGDRCPMDLRGRDRAGKLITPEIRPVPIA